MATEVTVESGNVVTVGVVTSPTVLTANVGSGVQGPAGATGATGAQGPAGPTGATGATGPAGANGISITAANIVSGNLVLTFSNTATLDVGNVVGPAGATGAAGPQGDPGPTGATGPQGDPGATGATGAQGNPGVSITNANVVSGNLIITFSNTSTVDAGNVVGSTGATGPQGDPGATGATGPQGNPGVSITAASVVSGNLIITFSNTTTTDAGNVVGPTGATGATGGTGPAGVSITQANVASGNLIITFSNTATADAGNVAAFASNATNLTTGTLDTARLPTTVNVSSTINVGNSTSNVAISSGNITLTGNLTGNTNGFTIGYLDVPQNFTNTSFQLALTDRGKHIYSANGTSQTITIANNATVAFPVGSAISIVLNGAGSITVARGSGVTLYLAANSTSADRTIAAYGMATLLKVATDTWFINGAGVT